MKRAARAPIWASPSRSPRTTTASTATQMKSVLWMKAAPGPGGLGEAAEEQDERHAPADHGDREQAERATPVQGPDLRRAAAGSQRGDEREPHEPVARAGERDRVGELLDDQAVDEDGDAGDQGGGGRQADPPGGGSWDGHHGLLGVGMGGVGSPVRASSAA